MSALELIISIGFVWNFIGGFILFLCVGSSSGWMGEVDSWAIVNPFVVYKYCTDVNGFGAIVIATFFTLICPIGALIYWFYKLCTVGRKV